MPFYFSAPFQSVARSMMTSSKRLIYWECPWRPEMRYETAASAEQSFYSLSCSYIDTAFQWMWCWVSDSITALSSIAIGWKQSVSTLLLVWTFFQRVMSVDTEVYGLCVVLYDSVSDVTYFMFDYLHFLFWIIQVCIAAPRFWRMRLIRMTICIILHPSGTQWILHFRSDILAFTIYHYFTLKKKNIPCQLT